MKKPKLGLYVNLLGVFIFLTACDILLLFPYAQIVSVIILIPLATLIGLVSFLMVREIRRPDESEERGPDETVILLKRSIGWGIFHMVWLTAGLIAMVWLKVVMHLPDPSVAGTPVPFAVFAGIVIIAIIVMLVRIFVNTGRIKKARVLRDK
ncbi:MAG: hypothetical protein HPY53_03215 [Brevinematales bacterium]|nr:hypothetical protein [Brevinematales bacterium]